MEVLSLGDKDLARVIAYLALERLILMLTLLITGLIVTYNVIKKLIFLKLHESLQLHC